MSQMKPYCFNCGAELDPDAIHCPACGRLQRSIVVRNQEDEGAREGDAGGQGYAQPEPPGYYEQPEPGYQGPYQPSSAEEQGYYGRSEPDPYHPDQGQQPYFGGDQYYQPEQQPAEEASEEAPYYQGYTGYPRYEPQQYEPQGTGAEPGQPEPAYGSQEQGYPPTSGYGAYPGYARPEAEQASGEAPSEARSPFERQPAPGAGQPVYSSPFTAAEPQSTSTYSGGWQPSSQPSSDRPAYRATEPSRPDPFTYSTAYGPPPQAPESPNWARRIAIGVAGLFCLFVIGFALTHLMGRANQTAANNPNLAPTPPTTASRSPAGAGGATPTTATNPGPSPTPPLYGTTPSPQPSLSGNATWRLVRAQFMNGGRCTTSQGCELQGTFTNAGGQGVGQATFNLTDQAGDTTYASCSVPLDSSQGNQVTVSCYANSPQLDQLFLSDPNASVYLNVQVQNPSGD
jgi:hypothetical protein